jgi:hypothetical protein
MEIAQLRELRSPFEKRIRRFLVALRLSGRAAAQLVAVQFLTAAQPRVAAYAVFDRCLVVRAYLSSRVTARLPLW